MKKVIKIYKNIDLFYYINQDYNYILFDIISPKKFTCFLLMFFQNCAIFYNMEEDFRCFCRSMHAFLLITDFGHAFMCSELFGKTCFQSQISCKKKNGRVICCRANKVLNFL